MRPEVVEVRVGVRLGPTRSHVLVSFFRATSYI